MRTIEVGDQSAGGVRLRMVALGLGARPDGASSESIECQIRSGILNR